MVILAGSAGRTCFVQLEADFKIQDLPERNRTSSTNSIHLSKDDWSPSVCMCVHVCL